MPAGLRALAPNIRKTNKCTLYPQPIHQTAYIFGYTDIRIRLMGEERNCGAETSDHSHPSSLHHHSATLQGRVGRRHQPDDHIKPGVLPSSRGYLYTTTTTSLALRPPRISHPAPPIRPIRFITTEPKLPTRFILRPLRIAGIHIRAPRSITPQPE
jgi:hypothetical protein